MNIPPMCPSEPQSSLSSRPGQFLLLNYLINKEKILKNTMGLTTNVTKTGKD